MNRLIWGCAVLAAAVSCKRAESPAAPPAAHEAAQPIAAATGPVPGPAAAPAHEHSEALEPLAVCQTDGLDPLSASRKFFDESRYEEALSCAAKAAAQSPDDALAHSERAAALVALGRFGDAQLGYARALAIDPDHQDALVGAAHLYTVELPSSREHDELGMLYADRGLARARDDGDEKLLIEFTVLSAMALNDLGQAREALERASEAVAMDKKNTQAQYERALALFELCRFPEAKKAFRALLTDPTRGAHAHHHLGLLLEREGRWADADSHFAQARRLEPEDFPSPQLLSKSEFAHEVARAVESLPEDMRRDLQGVPVTTEELPATEDLTAGDPPLSPTILGLFRGPSLDEECGLSDGDAPCRSVILYRRNLARAVRTHDELIEQIRVTLLHEIGHLRGEDDFELAARGLE